MAKVTYEIYMAPDLNWPPEAGDVWRTRSGTEYHILAGYDGRLRVEQSKEIHIIDKLAISQLEDMSPVLVYRQPSVTYGNQ